MYQKLFEYVPKLLLFLGTFHLHPIESAKILSISPFPSQSHAILGRELLKGFAAAGHDVTMLTFFPVQDAPKNFETILMNLTKPLEVYKNAIIQMPWYSIKVYQMQYAIDQIAETFYEDENVQKLIQSNRTFDAIFYLQWAADSYLGFSHKFNASSIMFNVLGTNFMTSYAFGNQLPSAYVPNAWLNYNDKMSFWQRFHNWISNIIGDFYLNTIHAAQQQRLLKRHFPSAPSLDELRANVDLELVNSHIAIDTIRPVHQNMINIGGYYMKNHETFPDDIRSFLDNSANGVILICFGTNLKSTNMDNFLIQQFLEYFRRSEYNILWKFDVTLSEKSANVKIVDWLPQRSVLAHPNVKLFITHGGKGSVNEAIYHGVPMIVVPFYSDQHANAQYCVQNKIAIKLDLAEISCDALQNAVSTIQEDSTFRSNIGLRSQIFKNQEIDPMKKAIYWTEAVIKIKGHQMFKSTAQNMPWYQMKCLDLMAMSLFVVCVLGLLLRYFLKYFTEILKRQFKVKSKQL